MIGVLGLGWGGEGVGEEGWGEEWVLKLEGGW